jgi:outer membrane lipoprotein-sorting protein
MVLCLILPGVGSAQLSVDEIVEKSNGVAYYQGKDGRAQVSMTIKDALGRERNRQFTILRKDVENSDQEKETKVTEQKYYVYFYRPADVNKTTFLVLKHLDKDDDRWLYLPSLDLVKRISATDKRTSFVGSNFYYEDVSGRSITLDRHELEKTTETYYVLKNTPLKPSEVEFSYYRAWVHKQTFIPVKIEFFDKSNNPHRLYEALKVETIEGFPSVTQARMKDLKTKGETTVTYSQIRYNLGFPEDIFSERYIRNPPRKHLR